MIRLFTFAWFDSPVFVFILFERDSDCLLWNLDFIRYGEPYGFAANKTGNYHVFKIYTVSRRFKNLK